MLRTKRVTADFSQLLLSYTCNFKFSCEQTLKEKLLKLKNSKNSKTQWRGAHVILDLRKLELT